MYLFFYELLYFALTFFPNITVQQFNVSLFIIGLILLRATGNIWYWTGECQSGRLYKVLRISNLRRRYLVEKQKKEYNQRDSCPIYDKTFMMARIIQLDRSIHNFFHRRKLLSGFITTFGFNCIYMSMYYLHTDKLQKFVADPKVQYLKNLPSVRHYEKINQTNELSLMYRTLSKNLSTIDSSCSTSNFQETNYNLSHDMNDFLSLQDSLHAEDSVFLYESLSLNSYYSLLGDPSAQIVTKKKTLLFHGCIYVITAGVLLAWFKWPLLEV